MAKHNHGFSYVGEKTAQDLERHAAKRAGKRYGIFVDHRALASYGRWIIEAMDTSENKTERAELLQMQPKGRSVWKLFIDGRWIPVAWDGNFRTIATFLPEKAIEQIECGNEPNDDD